MQILFTTQDSIVDRLVEFFLPLVLVCHSRQPLPATLSLLPTTQLFNFFIPLFNFFILLLNFFIPLLNAAKIWEEWYHVADALINRAKVKTQQLSKDCACLRQEVCGCKFAATLWRKLYLSKSAELTSTQKKLQQFEKENERLKTALALERAARKKTTEEATSASEKATSLSTFLNSMTTNYEVAKAEKEAAEANGQTAYTSLSETRTKLAEMEAENSKLKKKCKWLNETLERFQKQHNTCHPDSDYQILHKAHQSCPSADELKRLSDAHKQCPSIDAYKKLQDGHNGCLPPTDAAQLRAERDAAVRSQKSKENQLLSEKEQRKKLVAGQERATTLSESQRTLLENQANVKRLQLQAQISRLTNDKEELTQARDEQEKRALHAEEMSQQHLELYEIVEATDGQQRKAYEESKQDFYAMEAARDSAIQNCQQLEAEISELRRKQAEDGSMISGLREKTETAAQMQLGASNTDPASPAANTTIGTPSQVAPNAQQPRSQTRQDKRTMRSKGWDKESYREVKKARKAAEAAVGQQEGQLEGDEA